MMGLLRRLTPSEIETYDVIPANLGRRVWLVRVPVLPGPYAAMTIGPVVMLARTVTSGQPSSLLAHELVHVRQFHELGLLRFTWRYNRAFVLGLFRLRSWNKAYRAIPAEQEARRLASDWAERTFRRSERKSTSDGSS